MEQDDRNLAGGRLLDIAKDRHSPGDRVQDNQGPRAPTVLLEDHLRELSFRSSNGPVSPP